LPECHFENIFAHAAPVPVPRQRVTAAYGLLRQVKEAPASAVTAVEW
jgi:hypothetical protein